MLGACSVVAIGLLVAAVVAVAVALFAQRPEGVDGGPGDPALVERLRAEAVALGVLPADVPVVLGNCSATLHKRLVYLRTVDAHGRPFAEPVVRSVLLHEAAHVATPVELEDGDDHCPAFRSIRDAFVARARRAGYAVVPDASIPAEYLHGCVGVPSLS